MKLMTTDTQVDAKTAILRLLRTSELTPYKLFAELLNTYPEAELKHSLSELLNDSAVEFLDSRILRVQH